MQGGTIIAAESVKSSRAIRLEDLVVQMAEKIIKDFPLEGYIVHIDGEKVTIDLGKQAGVKTGMSFSVFREGNMIKHPKTGDILDIQHIQTGIVQITDIRDRIAIGIIVESNSKDPIE